MAKHNKNQSGGSKRIMYHGTDKQFAMEIVDRSTKIEVSRGSGEFGRGFYLGKSPVNATRWAYGRSGENSAVIKFSMSESGITKLKEKLLTHSKSDSLRNHVKSKKSSKSHLENKDIVTGSIEHRPKSIQSKFESEDAENFLNDINQTHIGI